MPTIYIDPGQDGEPIEWYLTRKGQWQREVWVTEEQFAILDMLTKFAADLDMKLWDLYQNGKWPEK